MRIILGSSSPRRRHILGGLFGSFDIIIPEIEERPHPGEAPDHYARRISIEKAFAIINTLDGENAPCLLITCDTIVTIDGDILGKPSDRADANKMLRKLSGRTHEVISGLTLVHSDGARKLLTEIERSRITFRNLPDGELDEYLGRIDFIDKAGAYAVQEHGSIIIRDIEGSVTNVIGFPLGLFFRMAGELNLTGIIFPGAQ